jgi:hypothetical protein
LKTAEVALIRVRVPGPPPNICVPTWRNQADALSSELRCCRFESCRRHRIIASVAQLEIESTGLRSLRTRVRVSPDAYADVAQPGRRAAPRTLLLEVQILSSAPIALAICRSGARGRRVELKPPKIEGSTPSFGIGFIAGGQVPGWGS